MKKRYDMICIYCGKSPIAVKGGKHHIRRCCTCGKIQLTKEEKEKREEKAKAKASTDSGHKKTR